MASSDLAVYLHADDQQPADIKASIDYLTETRKHASSRLLDLPSTVIGVRAERQNGVESEKQHPAVSARPVSNEAVAFCQSAGLQAPEVVYLDELSTFRSRIERTFVTLYVSTTQRTAGRATS